MKATADDPARPTRVAPQREKSGSDKEGPRPWRTCMGRRVSTGLDLRTVSQMATTISSATTATTGSRGTAATTGSGAVPATTCWWATSTTTVATRATTFSTAATATIYCTASTATTRSKAVPV